MTGTLFAQSALQQQITAIAADARGQVSVACSLTGTPLNCDLHPHAHPPMQSVFKLPLAITVLHLAEGGKFSLDAPIRFRASDRILPHVYSPLQDQYPNAEVDIPLRRLLELAVRLSDNAAADILLRITGGPAVVDGYLNQLGIRGFHLEDNEAVLHHEFAAQYRNWFEPAGAVQLLRLLSDQPPLTVEHMQLLFQWMSGQQRVNQRIAGQLPAGTIVIHKPGTSDTKNGLTAATNDIGLIVLPDGRRLALAVFITDSRADDETRDSVIARIALRAYQAAVGTGGSN